MPAAGKEKQELEQAAPPKWDTEIRVNNTERMKGKRRDAVLQIIFHSDSELNSISEHLALALFFFFFPSFFGGEIFLFIGSRCRGNAGPAPKMC